MTIDTEARLSVACDGRAWSSPAGGVRRYVQELYSALIAAYPEDRYVAAGIADPSLAAIESRPAAWSLPTNPGWMLTGLPATVRRVRPMVCHAPAYTAPVNVGCPVVLTIHDVVYARHPEWYPARLGRAREWFFRRSARSAARIVTDSAFSKSEIMAAYGIDAARIVVAPLGVSPGFSAPPLDAPRECVVLHVGDLHPRRNLVLLLDVVLELRRVLGRAMPVLVLIGVDRGVVDHLRKQADAAGDPDALRWFSSVPETELQAWYRRASVLAYPSKYEGFGLPLIEAMASGLPVVASRAASMPEVVGDAGVLVGPEDRRAWFAAIDAVLGNAARWRNLSADGVRRASTFTWARTAALTRQAFLESANR
jgi:glycosyltransferase involved in cell wall biosynthesis